MVFDVAGLAESHLGWLQGNFFGGASVANNAAAAWCSAAL